jgi:uncharacterized UPF0160 family protein
MDSDARKAEFVRAIAEAHDIMAGMRTETHVNDRATATSREAIQESRDVLSAPFDSGH